MKIIVQNVLLIVNKYKISAYVKQVLNNMNTNVFNRIVLKVILLTLKIIVLNSVKLIFVKLVKIFYV